MNDAYTEADVGNDWAAVAHRGQLELIVLTLAAARRLPIGIHPEAVLVSIVIPDGLSTFALSHPSLDAARSFIVEMEPHTLNVTGVRGENVHELRTVLHASAADQAGARAEEMSDALIARITATPPVAKRGGEWPG